jgi:hypothetical protein
MEAAEIRLSSGVKAVKLYQMFQIVRRLSRDLARRAKMAMTLLWKEKTLLLMKRTPSDA